MMSINLTNIDNKGNKEKQIKTTTVSSLYLTKQYKSDQHFKVKTT